MSSFQFHSINRPTNTSNSTVDYAYSNIFYRRAIGLYFCDLELKNDNITCSLQYGVNKRKNKEAHSKNYIFLILIFNI